MRLNFYNSTSLIFAGAWLHEVTMGSPFDVPDGGRQSFIFALVFAAFALIARKNERMADEERRRERARTKAELDDMTRVASEAVGMARQCHETAQGAMRSLFAAIVEAHGEEEARDIFESASDRMPNRTH